MNEKPPGTTSVATGDNSPAEAALTGGPHDGTVLLVNPAKWPKMIACPPIDEHASSAYWFVSPGVYRFRERAEDV